jgi:deferrochelatase/peroxidase EfeB
MYQFTCTNFALSPDKQPFVEEIQSNRTTLRPISSSEDDFMELLAQTNILNDAPDDLRHLSADMFPESLGDVQHLSTSAADSMSWMNSPTKSLLGNTFLTMGDDLQDLFMYSGWRVSTPFLLKSRT